MTESINDKFRFAEGFIRGIKPRTNFNRRTYRISAREGLSTENDLSVKEWNRIRVGARRLVLQRLGEISERFLEDQDLIDRAQASVTASLRHAINDTPTSFQVLGYRMIAWGFAVEARLSYLENDEQIGDYLMDLAKEVQNAGRPVPRLRVVPKHPTHRPIL